MSNPMHRLILGTLAVLSVSLASCDALPPQLGGEPGEDRIATVIVPDSLSDRDVSIEVIASGDKKVREAIKHMQNEDFETAASVLEQAVEESPNDHRALFALGVCYEWLAEIEKAVDLYKRANIAKSDPLYQAARVRAEGWLEQ